MNPTWKTATGKAMKLSLAPVSHRTAVALVLVLTVQAGETDLLDSLHNRLTQPPGVTLIITLIQHQYEDHWETQGYLEILGPRRYFLDTDQQSVKLDGAAISTWNKARRQLILDTVVPTDFSWLDLLAGEFQDLTVKAVSHLPGTSRVDFDLRDMDLGGEIWIQNGRWVPQKLVLRSGPGQKVVVRVDSIATLTGEPRFLKFNPLAREVIDLRE